MFESKILNPHILSLLPRVRHTNWLVIADRGFPFWPQIETIDIALMNGVPTVPQVLAAILPEFNAVQAYMAKEFQEHNDAATQGLFTKALGKTPLSFEHHVEFKKRVPGAIGLIRTGETVQYANMILVSG